MIQLRKLHCFGHWLGQNAVEQMTYSSWQLNNGFILQNNIKDCPTDEKLVRWEHINQIIDLHFTALFIMRQNSTKSVHLYTEYNRAVMGLITCKHETQ